MNYLFKKIIKAMSEEQNKQVNLFRDDVLNEIKEYIDYKFDVECNANEALNTKIALKINTLIEENFLLEDNVKAQLDKFNEISISNNKNLIAEIKRFENVMERAYYVQQEVDSQKGKLSFIGKLFGAR